MAEDDSGGTIKLIVLVIVILAFAWLMLTAYGKIKTYAAGSVEQVGNKYIEPVQEASYCKSDYKDISTSRALREYLYYIDIGNCESSPFFDLLKPETAGDINRGSPTLKNDAAIRCRWGQNTEEDYCGNLVFDLTRGGKADLHFNDMHYVDTSTCISDPNCAPKSESGRDLYICAQKKWQPSLFTYTEVSATDKSILLKSSPDMSIRIGRYGTNMVLCINSKVGTAEILASMGAYIKDRAYNPAKLWDDIKTGWFNLW